MTKKFLNLGFPKIFIQKLIKKKSFDSSNNKRNTFLEKEKNLILRRKSCNCKECGENSKFFKNIQSLIVDKLQLQNNRIENELKTIILDDSKIIKKSLINEIILF